MQSTVHGTAVELLGDAGMLADEGLIAIDADDRVALASPRARGLLQGHSLERGAQFHSTGVDFRVLRLVDAALKSGRMEEREISFENRDLVLRARRVDHPDIAVIVTVRDETRLHRLERVRRDFVSNVSHELRTPVTAVRIMAETLENGGLDDPAAAADFVRRIALEAMHMAQIVEELLELSTIESGLRPLAKERVSVDSLFSAVDRLRPLAEDKGVSLEVHIAPGTPEISGDSSRLGQVMRNLVHNAIKFTPRGGRIDVEASAGSRGYVVLRCRDTGVGIAPADLPRIFERFWKADSSRQRDGEGSGLGLAIVRHVVDAHGGSVSAASEPRHGTEFTVELPAATEQS
ncbi:MAG: histidine kinase [Candidatus Dormibacteraeota bacterium]|nr:histidine kinase [Candidatus Dormibacteraeota bacterium]